MKRAKVKATKKGRRASPRRAPISGVDARLRSIGVEEFVRRLQAEKDFDKRFAMFLGAGCSVSSGIPAAGSLVTNSWIPRLRDFQAPHRTDAIEWATETIAGFDPRNPASSYGVLIDRLFLTQEDRQREIENLCEGKTPSFGYAVLAQLIALDGGHFNVVLTTNFDDLIADALYLYTDARPLVIHHESLAAYIRPTRTRPLVVKLHGDHRLSPRNTALETANLEQEIQRHTAMVLHDRGVIFMGYGGYDVGILKLLNELPREALPYGAYWVHPNEPEGSVRDWLVSRGGVWVQSGWFDEVMLLIRNAFNLPHPNADRFSRIFANYQEKWAELSESIGRKPSGAPAMEALRQAVTNTEAEFSDYWKAMNEAGKVEGSDPDRAEAIFRQAIEQFPGAAPLLGNYANFLCDRRKDLDGAEAHYKMALEADPKRANTLTNYGLFLSQDRGNLEAACPMFKRALEVDPNRVAALAGFGECLRQIGRDFDEAEALLKRAVELDAKNAPALTSYALILQIVRNDMDGAETIYKRAIDVQPPNHIAHGSYGAFLAEVRKDYAGAAEAYKRSLEISRADVGTIGNYANLVADHMRDFDLAETLYKEAIEKNPADATVMGNYAVFLSDDRKDFEKAREMYGRALKADSKHLSNLLNYADFLESAMKDVDAAEAIYKRAQEIGATNKRFVRDYADFLKRNRRNK